MFTLHNPNIYYYLQLYGDQKVDLGTKCRKITVFLNPAASGGYVNYLLDSPAGREIHNVCLSIHLSTISKANSFQEPEVEL